VKVFYHFGAAVLTKLYILPRDCWSKAAELYHVLLTRMVCEKNSVGLVSVLCR
jgi:hypothetical protein